MAEEKKKYPTDITPDSLEENGWRKTDDDPMIIYTKKLPNNNPINQDPEDTDMYLVIHRYFNGQDFAVLFPTGGMLNFVANSLAELHAFENAIRFYDCPY